MMETQLETQAKRIRGLILGRLLIATIFLSLGNIIFEVARVNYYLLIAFVYFVSIFYSLFLYKKKYLDALSILQSTIDSLLVTLVIRYTCGTESVFSILYVLSILSASILLSARAGIFAAICSSVLYCGQYPGIAPRHLLSKP